MLPAALSVVVVAGLLSCVSMPLDERDAPVTASPRDEDARRLARLWQERTGDTALLRLPVGPGDVVEISVPGLVELESHTARVSAGGTISLPLLGEIQAAGSTEAELADTIERRLAETVMHHPSVRLFVREYRSRLVGVIGEVVKPGFYALAGPGDSILDMLALAGGMTPAAGPRIQFLPGPRIGRLPSPRPGPAPVGGLESGLPAVGAVARDRRATVPIVIDLLGAAGAPAPGHLNLPARPGDVILVPERGTVFVQGGVERRGAYPVTAGLTVLGAVAAAGGAQFVSDAGSVEVIRASPDGRKVILQTDLDAIRRGQTPDIAIEPGDIVEVSYSPVRRSVAWTVGFIRSVFGIGTRIGSR